MLIERTIIIVMIVWSLALLRSVPLRALAYTLPLPITVVLLTLHEPITGTHIWGVLLLVLFFRLAAFVRSAGAAIGWAVLSGLVLYISAAVALPRLPTVGFWQVLAVTASALFACVASDQRHTYQTFQPDDDLWDIRRFLLIVVSASAAAALGGSLGALVVTFPYSGVPLVFDAKDYLPAMSRNVTVNAFSLLAFFTGMYVTQGKASFALSLIAGWVAFAVSAILLRLVARLLA
jgi:hypothetical protein